MIKPDARILPTEEEFEAWQEHPVTRFVAAAYLAGAEKQQAEWLRYFHQSVIPADITALRLELKTREDAYRAFLETSFADYIALADPTSGARPPAKRPPVGRRPAASAY